MSVNTIKIGLDFHGVITKHPEYFSRLTHCAVAEGIEIHIITGGPEKVVADYLQEHDIVYTSLFAILDFYDAKNVVKHFANGEFKVPDKLWNSSKAEYCMAHGINIHIDDSTQYAKWFTTPFCHYDAEAKKCQIGSCVTIDFNKEPENALLQIKSMLKELQFY